MKTLRRTISFESGVEVEMLFTPHLYAYKGLSGASLDYDASDNRSVLDTYKDIMYLAAVNAWELDGHGTVEDFPYKRGDFHEWAMLRPAEFGKALAQAMVGLTGKTIEELTKAKAESPSADGDEGKKKVSEPTGPTSKPSLWARVASRRSRQR